MIPNDWQWFRRLIGGRWAHVTGYFWGVRWVRAGDGYELFGHHENWARGGWHAPFDWWENKWLPIYCRFAWFHLMRAESDGHFIVVYQRKNLIDGAPKVDGYYVSSSSWTPRGCHKAASGDVFFDNLCRVLGPEGVKAVADRVQAFKKGPQP